MLSPLLFAVLMLQENPEQEYVREYKVKQGQTVIIKVECYENITIIEKVYRCDESGKIVVGIPADTAPGSYTIRAYPGDYVRLGRLDVLPGDLPEPVLRPYRRRGRGVSPQQRQRERDEIVEALSAGERKYPNMSVRSPFTEPLDNPDGYITDPFWLQRKYYRGRLQNIVKDYIHTGVDLGTNKLTGRPVRGLGYGVVVMATNREFSSEGFMVILYHGSGVYSLYMHLKAGSFCVRNGEYVIAGQLIAKSGDTGSAKGAPHLHLATKVNGINVDPLQLIELLK